MNDNYYITRSHTVIKMEIKRPRIISVEIGQAGVLTVEGRSKRS